MGLICEKRDDEYYSFTIKEVCDLLNVLHEENQALKSDRARYEEECRLDVFRELHEENEQLKSACAKYKINPKNLEKVLDKLDNLLEEEYSCRLNENGEYE